ncbi:MAG: hypothetical protein VX000_12740 [Myxococcota bacterium]|nr:hypothetical protein [Myxococcota bacterium]
MAIKRPIPVSTGVRRLCEAVRAAGGRALVVGGTVRDAVLGRAASDIDLEVHGLERAHLHALLQEWGPVSEVGRSFGVWKLRVEGRELDVAMPRAVEGGEGAPHIGVAAAARRRDLTINAMAWDPLQAVLVDPLGGVVDCQDQRLRAADPMRFGDDPLRAWRVARFASTLGFTPDARLVEIARGLDVASLPPERVRAELAKLLLGDGSPALGWQVAVEVGVATSWLPAVGLDACLALERAAERRARVGRHPRALALMLTVLLGRVGEAAAAAVLDGLGITRLGRYPLRDQVLAGVGMAEVLSQPVDDTVLRKLAERSEVGLCCHAAAALHPRGAADDNALQATMLGVLDAPLPPLLRGSDLLALGVPMGPQLGMLLASVRDAQLAGDVSDPGDAKALAGRLWSQRPGDSRDG